MESIGRAKAALVFGDGAQAKCVITTVIAQPVGKTRSKNLYIAGPVTFEDRLVRHVRELILPLVESITECLGLPMRPMTLSVVNIGAASAMDLPAHVHGFSADLPIFLALLSARLGLPVPVDVLSTGHIASSAGDIAAVHGLKVKLLAAMRDRSIRCVVCPAADQDLSLQELCPNEAADGQGAVADAKRKLRVLTVHNVGELVRSVFPDEAVVLAALRAGYFWPSVVAIPGPGPVEEAVRFFSEGNEPRFWACLERRLLDGEGDRAAVLLSAYVRAHIRRKCYPSGIGRTLIQLMHSLPPATRRLKIRFPILGPALCAQLSRFAARDDQPDIQLLTRAAAGHTSLEPDGLSRTCRAGDDRPVDEAQATLATLLSELDGAVLARMVALPIDTARAAYVLDCTTVTSREEFLDTVWALSLIHI